MTNLLVAIALSYILLKIPFWILGSLRVSRGRSFLGSIVRGFVAYKTFGLLNSIGTTMRPPAGKPAATRPRHQPMAQRQHLHRHANAGQSQHKPWTPPLQTPRRPTRRPPLAPEFLQPSPQATLRDPVVIPLEKPPVMPEFSGASEPAAGSSVRPSGPAPRVDFQSPNRLRPARRTRPRTARAARGTTALEFRSAVPQRASVPPPRPPTAPVTPEFRTARPGPTVIGSGPQTPSVAPMAFYAPETASEPTPPPGRRGGSQS